MDARRAHIHTLRGFFFIGCFLFRARALKLGYASKRNAENEEEEAGNKSPHCARAEVVADIVYKPPEGATVVQASKTTPCCLLSVG